MSIPFFIAVLITAIFSSSQGDCQVTPDVSTQLATSSDLASQTDWTKQGTIANVTAGKVFKAWVTKGLSGAASAGIVGWVNSEGGFAMIGRAEGHYGNDLRTNSIAFGVKPIGLAYYTTEAGGGIYQLTPYTKYAPLGDPKWEDADAMNAFVAKAILAGDWNAAMDLTGGNHTFKQMAQMTDPKQATLVWQAYERGSTAHINPFQKQADAQKAYELFDGAKYSYNETTFNKAFGTFQSSQQEGAATRENALSLCGSGSYSKGAFGKDRTGKVNYTSYNAWRPDNLPADLKPYALDPRSVGLSYRSATGWHAIASTGGQCTDLSASLMYALWVKNGSHPNQRAGNGNMVVSNWVKTFGGSVDQLPSSGAVFSSAGSSTVGHTGVVSHVFVNGDILIVEQNYASYSGDDGGFGKYSWNYRYVTTAELKSEGYSFYSPAKVGYKITKSVGTVGK
ncbi:CHAP domain-containing protein [Streptococcus equi subsp. zooepidemicus]|uniref:phage tail tip lysozyme n=1 Tax=Streptococcus equi TaxID=1336 RepID=UPI001E61641F|nr:phage tail tip lysozyme [Streptococcus equi]MCD3380008.1 CHAP domain-containing protein [Streptococcus equi subsp. zooepidemicus]MCD3409327.1 CHAP domain-containing protein [Streptococcus equi subsp. zooepidemicus]MCD3464814.1 CHAP domain-containing protein [Streptococcus equi subsp. zooepidemicus]HEL0663235.1 CHAP domain-containing protein [Streptococcus equi subsp. zooepidemicus]